MSARLALDLDHDAIRLLSHQSDGWVVEGVAELAAADLTQRIAGLRQRAEDLAGVEPSVLLVLPRSQVLYTRFEGRAGSESEVGARLEGLTAYALSELVWDEASVDDETFVAAVALETLDEAMAFAASVRLKVVGLTSEPPEGEFPRLPVFQRLPGFLREAEPRRPLVLEPAAPPSRKAVAFSSQRGVDYAPARGALTLAARERTRAAAARTGSAAARTGAAAFRTGAVAAQAGAVAARAVAARTGAAAAQAGALAARAAAAARPLPGRMAARLVALLALVPKPVAGAAAVGVAAVAALALWPEPDPDRFARDAVDLAFTELNPELAAPAADAGPASFAAARPVTVLRDAPALVVPVVIGTSGVDADQTADVLPGEAFARVAGAPALFGETRLPEGAASRVARLALPALPAAESLERATLALSPAPAPLGPPPAEAAPGLALAALEAIGLQREPGTLAASGPVPKAPAALAEVETPALLAAAPAEPLAPDETAPLDAAPGAFAEPDPAVVTAALPPSGDLAEPLPDAALALLPPAPQERFEVGPDGFVAATPEGAPTPGGVLAFAGAPALVAPPRPGTAEAAAAARAAAEEEAARVEALAAAQPTEGEAVAQATGTEAVAEATEAEAAPVEVARANPNPELAAFRPLPRPVASPAPPAPDVPDAVIAEALAAPDEAEAAAEPVLTVSLVPRPRPAQAVPAPQQTAPQQATATRAAPVAPQIPSRANVAREATIENALPLNQLNLIGVYGSASDRRALVRLPTGRFVKLKVGDRIDGGQVAQIGPDRLLYQKGGRTLALQMPNT